jgi:putative aldouronate transport system permease protein
VIRKNASDRAMDIVIYILLLAVMIAMLFPFLYVVGNSLMTLKEYARPGMKLFPTQGITFEAYGAVFRNDYIFICYRNTLLLVGIGTTLSLAMTTVTGYALSRERLKGRKLLLFLYILTMLIGGGIIPNYLVVRYLGIMNTLWALILPVTINTFFLMILKNFFTIIPDSLEESAYMDGANEITIMVRIFIPLSIPAMVTIGLFYAVNYWNQFFLGVLYLMDKRKWPLQLLLREILVISDTSEMDGSSRYSAMVAYSIKMATIVVATVPIVCVYPFLQKYFSRGILVGAVKG